MPRVPHVDVDTLPEPAAARLRAAPPGNIFHTLAQAPQHLGPYLDFAWSVGREQALTPRLRELAILRVAALTGCTYIWAHHERFALAFGITAAEISAVRQGPDAPAFTGVERDLLRFVDEVTTHARASDATWEALAAALPVRELVELTVATSFYGMTARLVETLGIELEGHASELTVERLTRPGAAGGPPRATEGG